MGAAEQAGLFAHCASLGVNAQAEIVPKYGTGRVTHSSVARRIAHSHILARAVDLDVVAAGWRPTADGYFRGVTKARLLADVAEARGAEFADMIDHLKKPDMAREAEKLLEQSGWLPEPMRTPVTDADAEETSAGEDDVAAATGAEEGAGGEDAGGEEADGADDAAIGGGDVGADRIGIDADRDGHGPDHGQGDDGDWDGMPMAAE
jgi:ParB family chromosome partitioning protein